MSAFSPSFPASPASAVVPVVLADVAGRGPFRVSAVLGPQELAQQLSALGLRRGGALVILHRQGVAGLVVGCGESRIALAQDLARRILVVPFTGEQSCMLSSRIP